MVKILFLIPSLSSGGAEKVLRNLVNNMDQSKFDITVQTINEYDSKKFLAEGIRYKSISRCKSKIGKKIFEFWFRFTAEFGFTYPLYIKDDYDIEVAYLECDATKVMASSTNKKALKIAWVHSDFSKRDEFKMNNSKIQKIYNSYDKVICVSEDVRNSFQSIYGSSIESVVLHNVIDEADIYLKAEEKIELNVNNSDKIMVAVGRLAKEKNFNYLIDTCYKLKNNGYNFKLFIIGEGPERENLEKLIFEQHLEDVVELLGFIDNPYPYIKSADIVVCSSIYEGISTVITEGLILGKTVVTTPCSGMKELLGNSQFGMIAEDTPDGLYACICKIFDSPELGKYYSEAAEKRGKDFLKNKVIEETSEFFLSELSKKTEKFEK